MRQIATIQRITYNRYEICKNVYLVKNQLKMWLAHFDVQSQVLQKSIVWIFFIESPKNIELLDGSKSCILIPMSYFLLKRFDLKNNQRTEEKKAIPSNTRKTTLLWHLANLQCVKKTTKSQSNLIIVVYIHGQTKFCFVFKTFVNTVFKVVV